MPSSLPGLKILVGEEPLASESYLLIEGTHINPKQTGGEGAGGGAGARSKFLGGCQGRRTGVGVTAITNSLILRVWVTKVLKNGNKKWGGGGGWKGG